MKHLSKLMVPLVAAGLAWGSAAAAQQSHDRHHPNRSSDGKVAPGGSMRTMPNRPGRGMMGRGMMGRGMMGRGMMGRGMMGGCSMMRAGGPTYLDGRVAFLKAELKISKQQMVPFNAYVAAMKKNFSAMRAMRAGMMAGMSATSPVKRLDAHLKMMEMRGTQLRQARPALENLYKALNDQQKAKANQILTAMSCLG